MPVLSRPLNPRHVALIAYEAARAHKRVTDPKSNDPYWYDLDPDAQVHFQSIIDLLVAGRSPEQALPKKDRIDGDDERILMLAAIVYSLANVTDPKGKK